MEADAGDLTVRDVEILLNTYKDVVARYTSLSRAVRYLPLSNLELPVPNVEGTSASLSQLEGTSASSHTG